MKIVMATRSVFPHHGYGGMQLYIYNLSKNLVRAGMDVEIVTSYMGKNKQYSEVYEGIKYTFLPVKTSGMYKDNTLLPGAKREKGKSVVQKLREILPQQLLDPVAFIPSVTFLLLDTYRFWRFSKAAAEYLKGIDFDILHFYDMSGYHYLKLGKRKPVVIQTFGNECFFDTRMAERIGYFFMRKFIRECFRKAEIAGTCGDMNAADIIRISGIPKYKIKVMQNGINLRKITAPARKERLRNELGFDEDDFIMINVNRLSPDKHVDTIIRAYSRIKWKVPDSKLVIVGSGIEEGNLKKLSKSLGLDTVFLKNLKEEQLYKYLKAADVFINAAETRYLLLTVIEAMACGLPVITTAPIEDVIVNGKNGYVLGKREPALMAKKVIEIKNRKNSALLSREAVRTASKFDWEKVAKDDIKIYDSLLTN